MEESNKTNILSLDNLRESHENEFKEVEAYIEFQGEMVSFKYYEKFPELAVSQFAQETVEFCYKAFTDEEYMALGMQNLITAYTLLVAIDKFTDVPVPEEMGGRLEYLRYLMDFGLVDKITNQLPEEEFVKAMDKMNAILEVKTEQAKGIVESYNKSLDEIENDELKRFIENEIKTIEEQTAE